jgi:hypothetical protein
MFLYKTLGVITMKHWTIFILFLFSFHFVSTQTFHALTYEEYETHLTTQTKKQARLESGHKTVIADFQNTYKTEYNKWNTMFPSIENALDSNSSKQELPDTVFHVIITGQVSFVGNLKRNDTVIYRVFRISEEDVSTTLNSTFKKRIKSYGNFLLDTKGSIVGEIQDFGNNTFQSIKDNRLLLCSNKRVPGKATFIDPFSSELKAYLQTDSGGYIFVAVQYFKDPNKEKIRAR